jgi:hypothetical protein
MATKSTTSNSAASPVNDGATIAYGGNISAGTNVTSAPGFDKLSARPSAQIGRLANPETTATIASGLATAGVYKPFSNGTFQFNGGSAILRSSSTLSGYSNSTLLSGAADCGRKSINKMESVRSTTYGTINYVTGQPTTKTNSYSALVGSGYTKLGDDAARPTRAIPGELVISEGSKTPTMADYSAKTGG